MKPLLDDFTVRLILAVRVLAFALCVFAFLTFALAEGSNWLGLALSVAVGACFGVVVAFPDEVNEVIRR